MPCVAVLTYLDISEPNAGSPRRTNALLEAVQGTPILVQPRVHHPEFLTAPYPVDLGRKKIGINWGIFNLQWPANARVARAIIQNQIPEFIVCSTLWTVLAVRKFRHIPILLDAHNVDAVYMEEQYGARHPFTRLVQRYEKKALEHVRHVFACSETDREEFIRRYALDPGMVSVVPNGVDTSAFEGPAPPSPPDAYWQDRIGDAATLFFMGKLDYGPNREALEFIRSDLVPATRTGISQDVKIVIVGAPVSEESYPPEMIFTGRISDERLVAYMRSADVCIAPIWSGSGTRLKVIENLAAGRPVVSTPKGAEGLGLESGTHALLAEKDDFSGAVLRLLQDKDLASRLGGQGRDLVKTEFDFRTVVAAKWQKVFARFAQGKDC
jgi:glycosyltransferase involved in cell wall biosynthesis